MDSGKIVRPSNSSVSVTVDRRLPAGTYTVTWRVISADAHPVAGAFTFHVKSASAGGECAQVFGAGTSGSIDALFKFMRALDFALILLVVGGAVALALVLRSAAFELRARLYRILAGLSLGLVVAGALCIVFREPSPEGSACKRRSAGTPWIRCSRRGSARRSSGSSAWPS